MKVQLRARPAYTVAIVEMTVGEELVCERGSMVAMSAGLESSFSTGGGLARAALRKVAGQEDFFLARYRAVAHAAWLALAPPFPGDVIQVPVSQGRLLVQSGSFLAAPSTVQVDVRYAGARSVVLREGVSMLALSGSGDALLCAYGGIESVPLGPGETLIVDTGHLVAFTDGMKVRLGPLGSAMASVASGEGFVAELTGPGQVWFQTRAEQGLRGWLFPDRGHDRGR